MRFFFRDGIKTKNIFRILPRTHGGTGHVKGIAVCLCAGRIAQIIAGHASQIFQGNRNFMSALFSPDIKYSLGIHFTRRPGHTNLQKQSGAVFDGQHRRCELAVRHRFAVAAVIAHNGTNPGHGFCAIKMLPQCFVPGGLFQRGSVTPVRFKGIGIPCTTQKAGRFGIINGCDRFCRIVIFYAVIAACPYRIINDAERQQMGKKPFAGIADIVPGIVNQRIVPMCSIRILCAGTFIIRCRSGRIQNTQIRLGKKLQCAVGLQGTHLVLGRHKQLLGGTVHLQQL